MTFPPNSGQRSPFVAPVALSHQKMEPVDKHQRLIFTRASREDGSLFYFYFLSVHIVHLAQAMIRKVVSSFIMRSDPRYKGFVFRQLSVCISTPSLVVFFSNHNNLVYLYCMAVLKLRRHRQRCDLKC